MDTSKITKITLYINECYKCDREKKFDALHLFIIKNELPLSTLMIKRIELNQAWRLEAEAFEIDFPIVKIEFKKENAKVMAYAEFLSSLKTLKSSKKAKKEKR